jgi:hypothetical protein
MDKDRSARFVWGAKDKPRFVIETDTHERPDTQGTITEQSEEQ